MPRRAAFVNAERSGHAAILLTAVVQMGQDLFQFYLPIYRHGIGMSGDAIGAVLASFAGAYFVCASSCQD